MKDMDTSAKQDPQRREEVPTRVLFSSSQRGRRERRSAEGAGSGGVSRQVSERDSERRRTETGAPWSSLQILEGRRRGRSANAQGKGTEGTDIFALARDEKRNDIQMGVLQPFEFFPLLARLEHLNEGSCVDILIALAKKSRANYDMVMEMCAEEEKNRGVKRHAAYQRPMTMTKLTPSPAASPREEREGTGGLGGRRLIFSRHSAPTLSQGAAPSGAGKSPMALSPGDPLPSPSSQMMPSSASGLPESVRGARPFVSPLSGVSSSRLAEDETRRGRALLNQAIKDRASTTTSPPRKTLEEPKRRRVEAEGGTGTHTAELPSASSAAAAVPSANPPTGSVSLRLPEGESSQSFPQLLRSGSAASEQGSPASQSSDPLNFTWGGDILDFQAGTKPVTVKEGGTKRKWKEDEKEKGGGGGSA